MECCRGAKNRTDISWIYDIFQNCYASGILADFLDSRKGAAFHDAEQSSSQSITGQFYKDFIFCCIYRDLRKTCQKFFCLAFKVFVLDQKGNRLIACITCALDHLRAFCNKKSRGRFVIPPELYL